MCPIEGCDQPYLQWHHFDPEWHVEKHHRPEGMIALCAVHHALASSYSKEQLRSLKTKGRSDAAAVQKAFQWMRNDLLLNVGGNLYYQTPIVFRYNGEDIISIARNDEGYLTLSARMLSKSGEQRLRIVDHFWSVIPNDDLLDFKCPPKGHKISAKYGNGDFLEVFFKNATVRKTWQN